MPPAPKPKRFYVAVKPGGEGCGHQHSRREAAWNCASTIAHIYHRNGHPLKFVDVVMHEGDARQQVGRVEQRA